MVEINSRSNIRSSHKLCMHKVSIWYVTICDEHPVGFSFALFLLKVFAIRKAFVIECERVCCSNSNKQWGRNSTPFSMEMLICVIQTCTYDPSMTCTREKNLIHLSTVVWKALKRWRWAFLVPLFSSGNIIIMCARMLNTTHKPNRWRGTIKSISNVFTSTKYVIESMCCCFVFLYRFG